MIVTCRRPALAAAAASVFAASWVGDPGPLGVGQYHVFLDAAELISTLMAMGCTMTFQASTDGLDSGATHTIIAMLADNGHAPLMTTTPASIEITVG